MLQIRVQTERCYRPCRLGRHDHHPDNAVFHRVPHDAREYTSEVRMYLIDCSSIVPTKLHDVMTQLAHYLNWKQLGSVHLAMLAANHEACDIE